MRLREGPVQLATRPNIAPSAVHRILTTARLNQMSHMDRATGEPVRGYEQPHPGSLVHVDVKKIGNITDGGGRATSAAAKARRTGRPPPGKPRNQYSGPKLGYAFVHTPSTTTRASRSPKFTTTRPPAPLSVFRTGLWSGSPIVVSPSSGSCRTTAAYRSHLWRDACEVLSITPKRTGPYRPQTNGKVERFHRPWSTGGLMPVATAASKNDETHFPTGCTGTTSIARTRRAVSVRPSHN